MNTGNNNTMGQNHLRYAQQAQHMHSGILSNETTASGLSSWENPPAGRGGHQGARGYTAAALAAQQQQQGGGAAPGNWQPPSASKVPVSGGSYIKRKWGGGRGRGGPGGGSAKKGQKFSTRTRQW